jgi:hypothetical protein
MSYLAELREHAQNQKRATPLSVKSVKTPEKGYFDTFGTTPPGPFSISRPFADPRHAASARMQAPAPEVDIPRRLWLLRHADGRLISHSFTPPVSLAEVRAEYPGALILEDDDDEEEAEP